jgi:hypothetical protein
MNKKLIFSVLLVCLLAFMAVMAFAQNSNRDAKKITITGLTGKTGSVMIAIYSGIECDALGMGNISNNSVTFSLDDEYGRPFTGSGRYHLFLQYGDSIFMYTNGQTFESLGITNGDEAMDKAPTFNISSTISTIAFSQFKEPFFDIF